MVHKGATMAYEHIYDPEDKNHFTTKGDGIKKPPVSTGEPARTAARTELRTLFGLEDLEEETGAPRRGKMGPITRKNKKRAKSRRF